ncbi:DNA replication and repair protein RecF [Propionispora sp. 2/2-37]|uniref:DNA replication/repair protein RecF n=1 Tax=Propionispora sp. 2/2-37 TaxID=1677858 RepID=UPI0006BB97CF|nr:DNA replication/repair protein RecF [Propionispora sp. 2/2-37]CUH95763.1 DNA replication and repair protein RecF [Propionispora sp. 2/2-37]
MRINRLVLHNFRNYAELSLDFPHNVNIFIGHNAQGKTNILEAIYIGAMGRSYRTHNDMELVRWRYPQGTVQLYFFRLDVANELLFRFSQQTAKQSQHKEIIYNGYSIKTRELMGAFNVVLFSPEDLLLVKGMPAARRQFIDMEISQASPAYYSQLMKYNRLVSQRNNLLKKIRENRLHMDLLEPWDEQLVQAAARIVMKRREAVKKLAMLANLMHRKITASRENLTLQYALSGTENNEPIADSELTEWYRQMLVKLRFTDVQRGSTGIGPHRDDLVLTVNNGINLRNFGSQGQQRTGVLALKLAELEFIKSETGEYPVLLLDDVMSELDMVRREQLLSFIKDKIQTFITATDQSYFPEKKMGRYYYVNQGTVME